MKENRPIMDCDPPAVNGTLAAALVVVSEVVAEHMAVINACGR